MVRDFGRFDIWGGGDPVGRLVDFGRLVELSGGEVSVLFWTCFGGFLHGIITNLPSKNMFFKNCSGESGCRSRKLRVHFIIPSQKAFIIPSQKFQLYVFWRGVS